MPYSLISLLYWDTNINSIISSSASKRSASAYSIIDNYRISNGVEILKK